MLECTVLDKALDGMFENVLEVHWLCVDTDIALPRTSWEKRCLQPAQVQAVQSTKAGVVGFEVFFLSVTEFQSLSMS
jgi:hypothetical protein